MLIILLIVFILINIGLAYIDAQKIKRNISIYHGINGLVYFGLLLSSYFITHDITATIGYIIIRIPIFNTALNGFRGKDLNYLSYTTTSKIDQLLNPIIKEIGYWNYCFWLFVISLILILI